MSQVFTHHFLSIFLPSAFDTPMCSTHPVNQACSSSIRGTSLFSVHALHSTYRANWVSCLPNHSLLLSASSPFGYSKLLYLTEPWEWEIALTVYGCDRE
ncbi:hypothetical protein EYC80_009681 [Monilinia laxa]|uniref:Uncharacterized protein n=1 Tax=Monilinia laxa TaxID=61186 RepID=A0A5N6JYL7_MONLA|nr:hypothetical protein EYC80_009681 [Monilinia laxa]